MFRVVPNADADVFQGSGQANGKKTSWISPVKGKLNIGFSSEPLFKRASLKSIWIHKQHEHTPATKRQ